MAECGEGPMMQTSQFKIWRCEHGHIHLRVARAPGMSLERNAVGVDFLDLDTFNIFTQIMDNFRDTYCKHIAIPDEILKAFGEDSGKKE